MKEQLDVDLFAFWEYDLFPYMLGARVSKIDEKGYVYADAYQGWVKPFKILPPGAGQELYEKVKQLNSIKRDKEKELKSEFRAKLFDIIPYHPRK